METRNLSYTRWIVEGSNGQRISGPMSFEDALEFVKGHEKMLHQGYSASGPMPKHMAEGWRSANLGYIVRRVTVKVVETYN